MRKDRAFSSDLRQAVRSLRRQPGAAAVAILTMAFGIAGVATVFSFVNAALYRPLPYRDADRMIALSVAAPGSYSSFSALTLEEIRILRESARSFDRLAIFLEGQGTVSADPEPFRVSGSAVNGTVFELFAPPPLLGRGIVEQDVRDRDPVVVLGERIWRNRFASDPDVLGRTLRLDDTLRTIVGVMPESFRFYERSDLWIPIHLRPSSASTRAPAYTVLGRLGPTAPLADARRELAVLAARLPQPASPGAPSARFIARDGMVDRGPDAVRPFAVLFMTAALLVLVVGCTNIAALFLARADARRPEMTLRASLGATRWRLIRLSIAETFVLAGAAGALGLLLSVWFVHALKSMMPLWNLPMWVHIGLDVRVVVFTWIATLAAAATAGLIPALSGSRVTLVEALKGAAATATLGARESSRARFLVVAEVAVALTLFLGAAMILRTYDALSRLDRGFDVGRVMALGVSLSPGRYHDAESRRAFYADVGTQLRENPEVRATALQGWLRGIGDNRYDAASGRRLDTRLYLPERTGEPVARGLDPSPTHHVVSDDYFRAMGMQIVRGRSFGPEDGPGAERAVVLSQRLAGALWPDDPAPVGRRLRIGEKGPVLTVIGIASDVRRTRFGARGLSAPVLPDLYLSDRQATGDGWRLLVATTGQAIDAIPVVRAAARAVDPDQAVTETRVLPDREAAAVALRPMATVLTAFAGCAFVLSLIGLVGVVSQTVMRRRRELGIHLAMGATPSQVVALAMRRTMRLALVGCAIGLTAALIASRGLVGALSGVATLDLITVAGTTLLFAALAIAAAYIPARQAGRLDITTVLRDL